MLQHKATVFILALMVLLFGILTANLFVVRFKIGDIYPPYSSFRSDPLGTRALHDALKHLGLHQVGRHFDPASKLSRPESTCLITAGVVAGRTFRVSRKNIKDMVQLAETGCRLVIALSPRLHSTTDSRKEQPNQEDPPQTEKKSTPEELETTEFFKALGIRVHRTQTRQKDLRAQPSQDMQSRFDAPSVKWQQALWFEAAETGWDTIYAVNANEPVIIEKVFGKGSMVLMADSYVLSNESLKDGNNGALLTWLIGKKPVIRFNEYHLGVRKKPGISGLLKKYHLHGPAVYALVFIVLLLWKLSARLLPPDEHDGNVEINEAIVSQGEGGTASGLTGLLRQHIPEKKLIRQCVDTWKNTFVLDNQASKKYAGQYEKIKTLISEPDTAAGKSLFGKRLSKRIPEDYVRICRILSERENS